MSMVVAGVHPTVIVVGWSITHLPPWMMGRIMAGIVMIVHMLRGPAPLFHARNPH
ncbi:MAG: hypothetical protein ABI876_12710 [Bacteroidota bacterium]